MTKRFVQALVLGAVVSATSCVERSSEILIPTAPGPAAPSAPPPGGSAGALTGLWSSTSGPGIPASWHCSTFQWNITSQTATSIAGDFSAACAGVVTISGSASGQQNGNQVPFQVSGSATIAGAIPCPFALSGTGHIEDSNTMRVPYSGTTCLGPLQGEETLRRPPPNAPAPPPPPSPPPPPPSGSPWHVGPGPLGAGRAEQVVTATSNEFSELTAPKPTGSEAVAAAEELLLRAIWHLQHAGFEAARQRNPSGAISNDKLNIVIDGGWQAYDIFQDYGQPNQTTRVIFLPISGANPLPYPGVPD